MQKIVYQRFYLVSFPIQDFELIICSSRLVLERGANKHVKCWPLFLKAGEAAMTVAKSKFCGSCHSVVLWLVLCGTVTDEGKIDLWVSVIC